jgi:hypothetical protein
VKKDESIQHIRNLFLRNTVVTITPTKIKKRKLLSFLILITFIESLISALFVCLVRMEWWVEHNVEIDYISAVFAGKCSIFTVQTRRFILLE